MKIVVPVVKDDSAEARYTAALAIFGAVPRRPFGGRASLDTFSSVQWITAQAQIERYPF